ncbi:hypothetical protein HELRODRAFT_71793, partial [Helobdella robusta]|uniref:Phospholipid/glycerol acyltransferase domain-containing protein n=1 Tax=Helobdella robusta TaxID=6412 RepID=T1G0R8_HELRO
KDGYRDILQERRGDLDLGFTFKSFHNVPTYKYHSPRNYSKLKTDVLSSDRLKYTIERLSGEDKVKEALLRKEAELMYTDMAHLLNLKGVRTMAFMAIKVFKALFRRVYVNEEGVNRLQHIMQEYPVVLMPTHRSYMDFVLVTFVCYHYNLPVPAVAAAMDFKGMKLMGWLLQNCGAFYIRRSFGSDHLYWAIFTEYVQTQLKNGDHPLEFFIEGTRSRTNKSYIPKIGMLAASLESYFKAELPDVMIVPVSLTFDRIVEESLYAFELLGIPKPRESTSGLLKARKILSEDFGSVHIHIGEAISIRQVSDGKIDRVSHALEPRYINSLSGDEQILITNLAYQIVKQQQRQFIIPPGTLLATVFIQHAARGLHINELSKKVDWLKRQACNLGAYVDWPGNVSLMNVIHMCLRLHKNILKLNEQDVSSSSQSSSSSPSHPLNSSSLLLDASNYLMLASYRNHVTHLFVDVAMVMMAIKSRSKHCRELSLGAILFLKFFFSSFHCNMKTT